MICLTPENIFKTFDLALKTSENEKTHLRTEINRAELKTGQGESNRSEPKVITLYWHIPS